MRQEIEDLKTSLKEERWYTGELKKELERVPVEGGTKAIPLSAQVCDCRKRGGKDFQF